MSSRFPVEGGSDRRTRIGIAAEALEWISIRVAPHLAGGGSLHSKGSGGISSQFRRRFLARLDRWTPVTYATAEAMALSQAGRVVEHVVPHKRIAIEIIAPEKADPRANTQFQPIAGGPAHSPEDLLRIFDTLNVKCWVTGDQHRRLNVVADSFQWDAPDGDGWARYRQAEVSAYPLSSFSVRDS